MYNWIRYYWSCIELYTTELYISWLCTGLCTYELCTTELGITESYTTELSSTELLVGCPRGVMVKAMDCGIVVREFVLQSRYYVHFRANTLGKGMNPLILPAMG